MKFDWLIEGANGNPENTRNGALLLADAVVKNIILWALIWLDSGWTGSHSPLAP